jgi:Fic family protein
MKIPQTPPPLKELMTRLQKPDRMMQLFALMQAQKTRGEYLHWDKLRRHPAPDGFTHEEWWLATKLSRMDALRPIGLKDKQGRPFFFSVPELVMEELHQIDLGSGGHVSLPDQITNPQTRDRYLVSSLMEEAITSSQLEGAVTTREVAKEMIRTGRKPRDNSERMILNNYVTMQRIRELKDRDLTPELVMEIHRLVTDGTMEDPTAAGRFRLPHEERVVGDDYDKIVHIPPPAEELEERMRAMCSFANAETPDYFIHPAVRAILLHFWLAYDHPFYDGNGRTARALFYWAMIRRGYWLFEFISISKIIKKAPMKYSLSFLHTETDDNDLTYFLLAQTYVIRQAIAELHAYIRRKTEEFHDAESHMKALDLFNHRQVELLLHAIKHPNHRYTFASHGKSHGIVYQTARADLLDLAERKMLESQKKGKQWNFIAPSDLSERLMKLAKEAEAQT